MDEITGLILRSLLLNKYQMKVKDSPHRHNKYFNIYINKVKDILVYLMLNTICYYQDILINEIYATMVCKTIVTLHKLWWVNLI